MTGKLNRRGFIGSVAVLAVAPFMYADPWAVPLAVREGGVINYLLTLWRAYAKGKGSRHAPTHLYSSRWLQDQYVAELPVIQRFNATPEQLGSRCLAFKACRYEWVDWLEGYEVRMVHA